MIGEWGDDVKMVDMMREETMGTLCQHCADLGACLAIEVLTRVLIRT